MMNFASLLRSMALGLVLVAMPMLGACAPTVLDWSEEVKLHDGTIIVIKRHDEIGATGFPLSHRGSRKYWQFCYAQMNIHWKSKPEYFPEVFDIVDGKAYVRVTITNCILCELHDYPETSALYFVWEGGAWKKIDYKDFPPRLRYNMLGNTHYDDDGTRDVHGFVTIEQKEHLDAAFYRLMRQRPEVIGGNDRVTYNGPNRPPTYAREACKKCIGDKTTYYGGKPSNEVFLPSNSEGCN